MNRKLQRCARVLALLGMFGITATSVWAQGGTVSGRLRYQEAVGGRAIVTRRRERSRTRCGGHSGIAGTAMMSDLKEDAGQVGPVRSCPEPVGVPSCGSVGAGGAAP
jgi:hypothetical protein